VVYCIQAQLAFRNAARRNAVSTNIQNYIATRTTWGPVYRNDYTAETGDPSVSLEVRFTTAAEQQAAWTDILNQVGTGVNGPVVGSWIDRHDCPHDQPRPFPCVFAERRAW
jgi:hypothetical protein